MTWVGLGFWERGARAANGCLEWTGPRNKDGYGTTNVRDPMKRSGYRFMLAHRHAYELTFGPIPNGMNVLHHCDNPPCMEPTHFFLGTQKNNIDDCTSKGRRRQRHPHKLTEQDVREIRAKAHPGHIGRLSNAELAAGFESQSSLAARFGVSQPYISSIVRRESWTHI